MDQSDSPISSFQENLNITADRARVLFFIPWIFNLFYVR